MTYIRWRTVDCWCGTTTRWSSRRTASMPSVPIRDRVGRWTIGSPPSCSSIVTMNRTSWKRSDPSFAGRGASADRPSCPWQPDERQPAMIPPVVRLWPCCSGLPGPFRSVSTSAAECRMIPVDRAISTWNWRKGVLVPDWSAMAKPNN